MQNSVKLPVSLRRFFIQQMLKTMRESSFESDLLPKSEGEKMFQPLVDEQYAKNFCKVRESGPGRDDLSAVENEFRQIIKKR